MLKMLVNILTGFIAVLTNSQSSRLYTISHNSLSDALLTDWRNIAKDIKRAQGKLKAEAHDGRKRQA